MNTETLFSFKGSEPEPLPFRVILDNGFTKTNLQNSSVEELYSYGFIGPIESPPYNKKTQTLIWNSTELKYEIKTYLAEELLLIKKKYFFENLEQFFNDFKNSSICKKLFLNIGTLKDIYYVRLHQSLIRNNFNDIVINYRLRELINDSDFLLIQSIIDSLFLLVELTSEDIEEIETLFERHYFNFIFDIPSNDYIKQNSYSYELIGKKIIEYFDDRKKIINDILNPNVQNTQSVQGIQGV